MGRDKKVVIFLLVLIAVLWFINSLATDQLNEQVVPLTKTQTQEQVLYRQNIQLHDTLLSLTSLTYIASVAAARGFVPAQFLYLNQ